MTHERIEGKTPAGGDYSEIFYFDDDGKAVDAEKAAKCVIRECKNSGELIKETFGLMSRSA